MANLPDQNTVAEGTLSSLQKSATQPFGKIEQPNFYGLPDAPREWNSALEDIEERLQNRYAKPNLWEISAAFAKPQLGGFAASLGSASEAMAKNIEQQRAQEMPLAQIRLMKAQNSIQQQKRVLAENTYNNAIAKSEATGKPISDTEYAEIAKLVGETDPLAQAAKIKSETWLKYLQGDIARQGAQIEGQKAVQEHPYLSINSGEFKYGLPPDSAPAAVANYNTSLRNAVKLAVPSLTNSEIDAMGDSRKKEIIANYATKQTEMNAGADKLMADKAHKANDLLPILQTLRKEATDPDLAPIFSLFDTGDLSSQVKQFLDKFKGNPSAAVDGLTSAALSKIKNVTPEIRAKVDSFMKNNVRLVIESRGASSNPTDAFTELNANGSPSLGNSQLGYTSILDQMALGLTHDWKRGELSHHLGVSATALPYEGVYRKRETSYKDYKRKLISSLPDMEKMPSFYDPAEFNYDESEIPEPGKSSSANTSTTTGSTSSAGSKSSTGSTGTPSKQDTRVIGNTTYYRQPDGSYSKYPGGKP